MAKWHLRTGGFLGPRCLPSPNPNPVIVFDLLFCNIPGEFVGKTGSEMCSAGISAHLHSNNPPWDYASVV